MQKMKCIITGASGFIGGRLAGYFAKKGVHVITPLREKSGLLIMHRNIQVCRYENLKELLVNKKIDFIVHAAALTTANSESGEEIYKANVNLADFIADIIDYSRPRIVIFMSTVSIYGEIESEILTINNPIVNPNLYGISKLIAEQKLTKVCLDNKIDLTILRLPGTVGYKSHGNIVSRILKMAHQNEGRISLTNENSEFNNIISVKNLINYVENVVNNCQKDKYKIILPASSDTIKFKGIVEYIKSEFKATNMHIDWKKKESSSFSIDIKDAVNKGYPVITTISSLASVVYDIKNMGDD